MSKLMIPVHVDAKVLTQSTQVPTIDGTPFASGGHTLEAGVHLHWALPDALTRARGVPGKGGADGRVLFPAVPDLWLVVRFEDPSKGLATPEKGLATKRPTLSREKLSPRRTGSMTGVRTGAKLATSANKLSSVRKKSTLSRFSRLRQPIKLSPGKRQPLTPKQPDAAAVPSPDTTAKVFSARREWKAWVVDSRAGSQNATPLAQWSPPSERPPGRLTAVGVLDSGDELGFRGWGVWDEAKGDPHAHGTAYYPFSRARFGFHDDLAGVSSNAKLSYAVIGWYADRSDDPLYRSNDRDGLIERWNLTCDESDASSILSAITNPKLRQAVAAYTPKVRVEQSPKRATRTAVERRVDGLGSRALLLEHAAHLEIGPDIGLFDVSGPSEILCHGAVVRVPRTPPSASTEWTWAVRLSESIKRATAEVVAGADEEEDTLVSTEALLADLESQARTAAGYIDIPGALHEQTFATSPGTPKWFAEVHVQAATDWKRESEAVASKHAYGEHLRDAGKIYNKELRRLSSGQGLLGVTASADIGKAFHYELPEFHKPGKVKPSKPQPPTNEEVDQKFESFAQNLRTAHASAVATAATQGRTLDPRWTRVVDHRPDAPSSIAPDIAGSASAGWWLDIDNDAHVRALLIATWHVSDRLQLPSAARLYQRPGPRWYLPGAPQLSVEGVNRSYRHGFDGRYESDGKLCCRLGGHTTTSINVNIEDIAGAPVLGQKLLANAAAFGSSSGLPSETRGLLEEVLLLDPSNAGLMAKNWRHQYTGPSEPSEQTLRDAFDTHITAWMAIRQPDLHPDAEDEFEASSSECFNGTLPSPIGVAPWVDPWLPLFVDVRLEHLPASITSQYSLDEVELATPKLGDGDYPSTGAAHQHDQRAFFSSSLTKISAGQLVRRFTLDENGNPIPQGTWDLDPNMFERHDLLTAALVDFDEQLRAAGEQERSGRVHALALTIVDGFGTKREWTAGPLSASELDPRHYSSPAHVLGLSPRLPEWGRVMCRFMAAANGSTQEADFSATPVCGFLMPDFVEHALELFDGDGQTIGQLLCDPPVRGKQGPTTLEVRFEPHPWRDNPGSGLQAIQNLHLREVVAGIVAQQTPVPSNAPDEELYESALTQLLRLFDTVGGTVAVSSGPEGGGRVVRLLGKAVAIVRTRVWVETSAGETPDSTPAPHPPIRVQIGAISRPDDGVYGVFLPGASAEQSRFAAVDPEALDQAVVNGLRDAIYGANGVRELEHPFLHPPEGHSEFAISHGQVRDLSVFVEVGGHLYLTSGVLPRKKLTLDPWFTADEVQHIEPTFKVGPVLATQQVDGKLRPLLPHPDVPGYDEWWIEKPTGENPQYALTSIAALPGEGALPRTRCMFAEGWVRLEPSTQTDD